MKYLLLICLVSLLLSGCSNSTSNSAINRELMDDNAVLVTIEGRTTFSELSEEDIIFMDDFLEKHFNNKETFEAYSKKEQEIVMEAVKKIETIKNR